MFTLTTCDPDAGMQMLMNNVSLSVGLSLLCIISIHFAGKSL